MQNTALRSTITSQGTLVLSLDDTEIPDLKPDQVVIRVEASPVNPSDLGMLFGAADITTARAETINGRPAIVADVPEAAMRFMKGRLDAPMPVGNEGAGTVVAAGSSPAAQALMGRMVAAIGGGMYAHYRLIQADQCLVLNDGTTAEQGASCFVNPLTALGMVETMRLEGHKALVHTAAASNLGQMLVKLCAVEGVDLVNIVRKPEQAALLKDLGAVHVCDSSQPDFKAQLTDAIAATGATLAFDATGGGTLADDILTCMEAALLRTATNYDRYGSSAHKQVYIYGGLERKTTALTRTYGMAWGVGGWLMPHFLARVGPQTAQKLRQRVADNVTTIFASRYSKHISLADMLDPEIMRGYGRMATGEKVLVRPNG